MDGYESSELEYSRVSTDILKPIYIHMEWGEVIERLNNIEEKILNHIQLRDDDALDMVFLPMYAPKNKAEFVTEKIAHLFVGDNSLTGVFREDIWFSISIMIKKYFNVTPKARELLKFFKPKVIDSRLRDVVDFEVDYIKRSYEHEISEMKDALSEKDKEIKRLKAQLEENSKR